MFITKWIEGERNLIDLCKKNFHEEPHFVETIGRIGIIAKVYKIYKWREDKQQYTDMYLFFMEHTKGTVGDINDIRQQSYEQIRACRSSILRP